MHRITPSRPEYMEAGHSNRERDVGETEYAGETELKTYLNNAVSSRYFSMSLEDSDYCVVQSIYIFEKPR